MRHQAECLVVGVGGKGGTRRAGLLAPDLLARAAQNAVGFAAQNRDLLFGEAVREKHIALLVESSDLLGCELHGALPGTIAALAVLAMAAIITDEGRKITRHFTSRTSRPCSAP